MKPISEMTAAELLAAKPDESTDSPGKVRLWHAQDRLREEVTFARVTGRRLRAPEGEWLESGGDPRLEGWREGVLEHLGALSTPSVAELTPERCRALAGLVASAQRALELLAEFTAPVAETPADRLHGRVEQLLDKSRDEALADEASRSF